MATSQDAQLEHLAGPAPLPDPLPAAARAFALLGKRWNGLILAALAKGPGDFAEIRERVPGITDRMLADRLQELATVDLVARIVQPGRSADTHYTLTSHGKASLALLGILGYRVVPRGGSGNERGRVRADPWVEPVCGVTGGDAVPTSGLPPALSSGRTLGSPPRRTLNRSPRENRSAGGGDRAHFKHAAGIR